MDTFMLIFTSGTSGDPKAVQVPHITVLMAGTALSAGSGSPPPTCVTCPCRCSTPTRCSRAGAWPSNPAPRWSRRRSPPRVCCDDVRRYGVTYMNYVGKPLAYVLATPAAPRRRRQSAAGRLRQRGQRPRHRGVRAAIRLHGLGRLRLHRGRGDRDPRGRLPARVASAGVSRAWRSTTPRRWPSARRRNSTPTVHSPTPTRRSANWSTPPAPACSRATTRIRRPPTSGLRNGMYWSGDLAYRDADGWIYLAGRTSDWMRVDGENMAAAPIERILLRLDAHQPGRGVRRARRARRRPGDGRRSCCTTASTSRPPSSRRSSPGRPTCRRRRGRATSGSPMRCPPPRPTRCSSANSRHWAAHPSAACCGRAHARGTSYAETIVVPRQGSGTTIVSDRRLSQRDYPLGADNT